MKMTKTSTDAASAKPQNSEEFLNALFDNRPAWVCEAHDSGKGIKAKGTGYRQLTTKLDLNPDNNHYFSTASFKFGAKGRRIAEADGLQVLVLDDMGAPNTDCTFGQQYGLPEPTYAIETSSGSYHLGWALDEPLTDLSRASNFVRKATEGSDSADQSGNNIVRWVRLPSGVNRNSKKYGDDVFNVELSDWTGKKFAVEELEAAFKVSLPAGPGVGEGRESGAAPVSLAPINDVPRIRNVLASINPNVSEEVWQKVCKCIINELSDTADAWELFNEWSSGYVPPKGVAPYSEPEARRKFEACVKQCKADGGAVKHRFGTLHSLARQSAGAAFEDVSPAKEVGKRAIEQLAAKSENIKPVNGVQPIATTPGGDPIFGSRHELEASLDLWTDDPPDIDSDLFPLPKFDPDIYLPPRLAHYFKGLTAGDRDVFVAPEYAFSGMLTAMCGVIGRKAAIKSPKGQGTVIRPVAWGLLIGEPSTSKTSGGAGRVLVCSKGPIKPLFMATWKLQKHGTRKMLGSSRSLKCRYR